MAAENDRYLAIGRVYFRFLHFKVKKYSSSYDSGFILVKVGEHLLHRNFELLELGSWLRLS